MAERRPLVEGLKPRSEAERKAEAEFVFQDKPNGTPSGITVSGAVEVPAAPMPAPATAAQVGRSPLTTRVRSDLAEALKRASLQRQLQKVQPSSVQDILEAALEPWLRDHGYLS